MGPDYIYGRIEINALGSTTTDERHASIPRGAGKFKLVSAKWTPSTDLAINGSNYSTLTLKKGAGGASIASITTNTGGTAWTKGTAVSFDLSSAGTAAEFNAETAAECLEFVAGKNGTVTIDGAVDYCFARIAD